MLGAAERGISGCMIASVYRQLLCEYLNIDKQFYVQLVLALGKAAETVVLEDIDPDGDIRYWRDEKNIHHVPKRQLDDVIIKL